MICLSTMPTTDEPTLSELLARYEVAATEAKRLEEKIKQVVLEMQETVKCGRVTASYSSGRGSYDYEAIAKEIGLAEKVLKKFSKLVVNYKQACEDAGIPKAVLEKHYKPGTPGVSIKLAD